MFCSPVETHASIHVFLFARNFVTMEPFSDLVAAPVQHKTVDLSGLFPQEVSSLMSTLLALCSRVSLMCLSMHNLHLNVGRGFVHNWSISYRYLHLALPAFRSPRNSHTTGDGARVSHATKRAHVMVVHELLRFMSPAWFPLATGEVLVGEQLQCVVDSTPPRYNGHSLPLLVFGSLVGSFLHVVVSMFVDFCFHIVGFGVSVHVSTGSKKMRWCRAADNFSISGIRAGCCHRCMRRRCLRRRFAAVLVCRVRRCACVHNHRVRQVSETWHGHCIPAHVV